MEKNKLLSKYNKVLANFVFGNNKVLEKLIFFILPHFFFQFPS